MAWEAPIQILPGLTATTDLSTNQFYCVKIDRANADQVILCVTYPSTLDRDKPLGILQNKPTAGQAAAVMTDGVTKAVCGATVAVGDEVGVDSTSRIVTKQASQTGADIGDFVIGDVLEGGAVGELATIKLRSPYRI